MLIYVAFGAVVTAKMSELETCLFSIWVRLMLNQKG